MPNTSAAPMGAEKSEEMIALFSVDFDPRAHEIVASGNAWAIAAIIAVVVGFALLRGRWWKRYKSLEIDEAEIGVGVGKIKLRPNMTDRQVAYQIWVELSTRKIGLQIDLEHDVVAEIYDSWHTFFGVTRDLIKSVPVSRVSDVSTKKIINLSIEVLNEGLRPHLTRWQARFRNWYSQQQPVAGQLAEEPQRVQKNFPEFSAMEKDLLAVNQKLMAYRRAMHSLVYQG